MEILYRNKKILKAVENIDIRIKDYGHNESIKIEAIIDAILAADNLSILVDKRIHGCHLLRKNRKGQVAFSINNNYRLIAEIIQKNQEDLSKIEKLKIINLKDDYHGK